MILDDHKRFEEPGCTCQLETSFGAGEPGTYADDQWCVYDAECEVVCTTPSKDYAELIAHALNRMDESHRCTACRIHDKAYWDKRYAEWEEENG